MAWTVTRKQTVFGNQRAVLIKVTTDSASEAVSSGLSIIDGISIAPSTMATATLANARPALYINANTLNAASNGTIGVTGCTSGDVFFLTVYGR